MKTNIVICVFLFFMSLGFSQNKQLLYGLEDLPQSLMVNPGGRINSDSFLGVPFLSQLYLSAGSTGVTAFDVFQQSNTSINERIGNIIHSMSASDFFSLNQQIEALNFGWRSKNGVLYSGGVYQESDMIFYFPRDMAILAWEGNRDYLNTAFNFGDINFTGDILTVYHFGINKDVNDYFTFGVRGKVYSSILNFKSIENSGAFITVLGDGTQNIFEHQLRELDLLLNTSGYVALRDGGRSQIMSSLISRSFFSGNLGLGFDVGATYLINDKWTISGSVLDVGAIFHTQDVESYRISGNYVLDGIEMLFPGLNDEDSIPYYDNLETEITEQIPIDTLNSSYTQWRPAKFNLALQYSLSGNRNSQPCDCRKSSRTNNEQTIGLHLFGIVRPKSMHYAATFSYYNRINSFFSMKMSYTIDAFSQTNFGLILITTTKKFNFFIAGDNILNYSNLAKANSLSLQLGLNINFRTK